MMQLRFRLVEDCREDRLHCAAEATACPADHRRRRPEARGTPTARPGSARSEVPGATRVERSRRARSSQFRPAVPPRTGARFGAARRVRPPFLFPVSPDAKAASYHGESGGLGRPESSRSWLEPNDTCIHVSILKLLYAQRCFICAYAINVHATKTYESITTTPQHEATLTPWAYQGIGVKIKADKN